jgi:hypothetical protein
MKRVAVLMVVLVIGLVPAAGAYASSLTSGHGGVSPAVTKTVAKPAAKPAQTVTATTLPFTGVSLGAFAVVGVLLVGLGVALRRTTRDSA